MKYSNSPSKIAAFGALLIAYAHTPATSAQARNEAAELTNDRINSLTQEITQYEDSIQALEGSFGANSSELYLSLAEAQLTLGNTREASEAYREALQSLRVSFGLYSEQQFDVIQDYNSVLFDLEDWEQIDSNLHLATHLAGQIYGSQDSRYVSAATALASWKIKAFDTGLFRANNERSVVEAARIYRVLIDGLAADDENYNAKKADYLQAEGLAHFYSAKYVADLPVDAFQANAPETVPHQQCYPLVMSIDSRQPVRTTCQGAQSNPEFFAAQQRAKNETVRRHLVAMRESFASAIEVIEEDASASIREIALATLNLGDASLLAQDYQRANSQYRKAWELLSRDGESATLREELLGQPVRVMQGVLQDIVIDDRIRSNVLSGSIAFDVTERGEIENIDIQGRPQDLERENVGAIAIRLDQATFRPRIHEGRPVTARIKLSASEL